MSEGAGQTTVTVTGTLDDAARTTATSVTVSVGGDTATAGTDFDTVSDFPLTIAAGATSGTATFRLTPTDDNLDEDTETLTVSGATDGLTVDSATLEITDNDTASTKVTLSVDPDAVSEGAGETTDHGDGHPGRRGAHQRDIGDRVGRRRHGHGGDGLRHGLQLHADHLREHQEWHRDVQVDPDGRQCS